MYVVTAKYISKKRTSGTTINILNTIGYPFKNSEGLSTSPKPIDIINPTSTNIFIMRNTNIATLFSIKELLKVTAILELPRKAYKINNPMHKVIPLER